MGQRFLSSAICNTLEIGYDVPEAGIEIILASTSNMNQVIQRIGRVIRKQEQKFLALIYVIYVSDTKDNNILEVVSRAVKSTGEKRTNTAVMEEGEDGNEEETIITENMLRKIEQASKDDTIKFTRICDSRKRSRSEIVSG